MFKKLYANFYYASFDEIDFGRFEKGFDTICFDFDNTLVTWGEDITSKRLEQLKGLADNFKIFIFSNGSSQRIQKNFKDTDIKSFGSLFKPLTWKMKRVIKKAKIDPQKSLFVGDNLITDIFTANRLGFTTIYVHPISNNEFYLTKFWRFLEKVVLLGKSKR